MNTAGTAAQLLVWTDVDPDHEADFNAWYDHEHMEERVAIEGFSGAQRYRSRSPSARRYLALYRASGLDCFGSADYRRAFENQTEWSVRNLNRMRNTRRRVMAMRDEVGFGWGSALALVELEPGTTVSLEGLAPGDGVLHAQFLVPDPDLSTPLPAEETHGRILAPMILVDTVSPDAAERVLGRLRDQFRGSVREADTFSLIWALSERDLPEASG